MAKLSTGVVLVLLGGALLAGCGGSSKSPSSTSSTGTTTAHQLTAAQRVEACKRILHAPSPLPASTKAKLAASCEKVGTSTVAARKFVHEVCEALASREPAGAVRARALATCRRAP